MVLRGSSFEDEGMCNVLVKKMVINDLKSS